MRTVDIIAKKRDGKELTEKELNFLIQGATDGSIPDYQLSAWAMAVYFRGMTDRETALLTLAMAESGEQMDLSRIHGRKVDKHSTGGVADTTTLILAPLVAAAGVPVAKMSGRGLGHTGGTLDKLEAIPGYRIERSVDEFINQVNAIGVSVIGQTGNIAPADKNLYSLRDVTATVNSIPLIASSVMSKKIASGADAIVLDVKTGQGAFMKTLEDSVKLAQSMVAIGSEVGRETIAVVTDMDEPLGHAIGNALEVKEAMQVLRGELRDSPLHKLSLLLGAHMLVLGGKAQAVDEAVPRLQSLIDDGSALAKWRELIAAQGGDPRAADQPDLLPSADYVEPVAAPKEGYLASVAAEELGLAAMHLGAGRATKDDSIDLAAGIVIHKKSGETVQQGELLAELHYNKKAQKEVEEVRSRVLEAFHIAERPNAAKPLVYATVTRNGIVYSRNEGEA
ncbi:pyrimidine-nucleoside phosphorylase [Paenibacillus senegalensis]|uniref:pyrimidine-nucleoside phosphorylase n=1 Tax=Paenibacillus senegalensis TaxID=1465766 RepID=UPI0002892D8F|nr:pyrimidine-nucleoside phosphorylase [Paenibacillus senegalensis]